MEFKPSLVDINDYISDNKPSTPKKIPKIKKPRIQRKKMSVSFIANILGLSFILIFVYILSERYKNSQQKNNEFENKSI